MILRSCLDCKFHSIPESDRGKRSRCNRENCFSEFSKCIAQKALESFLEQDSTNSSKPFSAIEKFYPKE